METVEMNLMQAQIAELTAEVTRLKTGSDNIIAVKALWDEEQQVYHYSSNKTPAQAYNIIKNGGYGLKIMIDDYVTEYHTLPGAVAFFYENHYTIELYDPDGTSLKCAWDNDQGKYVWTLQ